MKRTIGEIASVMLMTVAIMPTASAQEADVLHYWTSGSESAALKVFADEFKARGGTWIDSAVGGFDAARASALNRIAGGNPPTALLDNVGDVRIFAEQGILSPLEPDVAAAVAKAIPEFLVERLTYDGKLYAIPVDVGGTNWMWYSIKAFADIGAEPPATWDDFFAVADKLKDAGYIPLAFGGQPWQQAGLLYNIMLSNGVDFYNKVMAEHDAETASGPLMVKTFETMRKLTNYVDEGSQGRNWNDATNLVITGKAALQVIGDYAKGEFVNAGKELGKDFGCEMAPGTENSYLMVVDLFDFPKVNDPEHVAGQKLLQEVIADVDTQVAFSAVKGSLPGRIDADLSKADACLQRGQKIMSNPEMTVPNYEVLITADQQGQVKDLVSEFWSSPNMSAEEAAKQFAAIVTSGS